jgi:hypothetical protein
MLTAHLPVCLLKHTVEEAVSQFLVQQTVAVLAEL